MLPESVNTYSPVELISLLDKEYENHDTLNIFQHTIQALSLLDRQVRNGGYIQLIHNKFGEYIFENAWTEPLAYMGAGKLAGNLSAAKTLYVKHVQELEREMSLKEFSGLYDKFPAIEALHQQYLSIIDDELQHIQKFIENNYQYFEVGKKNGSVETEP